MIIALNRKSLISLAIFIGAMAVLFYVLYLTGLLDLFTNKHRLLKFIADHKAYAAVIFIGLQALQVVFAPIPGEVTGFVGGMLFGTFWGIVYSTFGLTLGSWVAFSLGRVVGRPLVEAVIDKETISRYDYVMKHKGLFLAFLLFVLPGFPKDYLCYLLGLGHMGHTAFLLVSTLGRLLGTTLLTLGGAFFRAANYRALFTLVSVSIFFILITMVYRTNMERWFRRIRAMQRLKSRSDNHKLGRKNRN
jgi:uncharacterized membrane protein YdjX (TVP38/TMEM64 family)